MNFFLNKGYIAGKMLSFHKWEDPPPSLPRYLTDFKINENYLPYSLLKISLIYTSTMFHIPVSLLCKILY